MLSIKLVIYLLLVSLSFSDNFKLHKKENSRFKVSKIIKVVDNKRQNVEIINDMQYSPNAKYIAVVYDISNYLNIYDVKTTKLIHQFSIERKNLKMHSQENAFTSLAYSSDSKMLAIGGMLDRIILLDSSSGKLVKEFLVFEKGHIPINSSNELIPLQSISNISFSSDNSKIMAYAENSVCIWDVSTGKLIKRLYGDSYVDSFTPIFSPIGDKIFIPNTKDNNSSYKANITIFDTNSYQKIKILNAHNSSISSLTFGNFKSILASSSIDNSIKIWDTQNGKLLKTIKNTKNIVGIEKIFFSYDNKQLLSLDDRGFINIFSMKNGETLYKFKPHKNDVDNMEYSPNSKSIATSSRNIIKIWK